MISFIRARVGRWATPPQASTSGAQAEPPAEGGGVGTSPPSFFNRRVRLLIEVFDEVDEVALATQLIQEQGWAVRTASAAEAQGVRAGFTGLMAEARLRGARLGACRHARSHASKLFEQRKLAAWVRDASLVQPDLPRTKTVYHVYRTTPADTGRVMHWLLRHWHELGGSGMHRTLVLPGPPDVEAAQAELAERTLGAPPFDPEIHAVRLGTGPRIVLDENRHASTGPDGQRIRRIWGNEAPRNRALFFPATIDASAAPTDHPLFAVELLRSTIDSSDVAASVPTLANGNYRWGRT
jgi:hypothetical protein